MKTAERLYQQLTQGSLDPESFKHANHIRLAWYYLNTWGEAEAIKRFTHDLQAYTQLVGAQSKYHHTISIALLRLMASHFPSLKNPQDWDAFKTDAQPLFTDAQKLLQRFYSTETLNSATARASWVEPDKEALP